MNAPRATRFRLCLLATGGTIEKTYDAHEGRLVLGQPVIEALVAGLTHPDIAIDIQRLMAVDSLDMEAAERAAVVARIQAIGHAGTADAIIVTHGTDTLATTARAIAERIARPTSPIILTGAMRPYRVADSDAAQNLAQAIMAARLVAPGVYGVLHGRLIVAERLEKDYERLTFVERDNVDRS